MMGLQHILKFIQPLSHATCCLESIFPPKTSLLEPSASCSSRSGCSLGLLCSSQPGTSLRCPPGLDPLFPGSHVFLFLDFSPLFCWSTLSGNFLNNGYVGGIYILNPCMSKDVFILPSYSDSSLAECRFLSSNSYSL